MKVKPMIFNTDMVRALMDGKKTQTRRPINPQPSPEKNWKGWVVESSDRKNEGCASWADGEGCLMRNSIYAKPPCGKGDLIYVRETFGYLKPMDFGESADITFKADGHYSLKTWKPSIHMPREFSRATLEVTGVRVERVQDISKSDAIAEGFQLPPVEGQEFTIGARTNFRHAWQQIYGKSWDRNDWVWVIDFEVIHQNVDDYLKSLEAA
tara:strand:- start:625 stop:1254 length:630 start_codon:yes stop_codon:yes gene_type:complete